MSAPHKSPAETREKLGPVELKLQAVVSHLAGCWEQNLGHMQGDQVLILAEPSHQPLYFCMYL